MGEKTRSKTTQWAVVGLIIAVVALAAVSFNLTGSEKTPSATTTQIITQSGDNEFCANNPALDGRVRIRDVLATTKTYLSGDILIQNLDTGSIVEKTVTASGSDFTSLADEFDCKSKKGYAVYVKAGGDLNSAGKAFAVAPEMLKQNPVEFTLEASAFTSFKVKAYDEIDKAKALSTADNSSDYVTALDSVFYTAGAAGFDTAGDQGIDVTFTLAPNTSGAAHGKGMYIALDTEDATHLADFDETQTQVFVNGVALKEATGLSENELRALNSYESLYAIADSVGMSAAGAKVPEMKVRVVLNPESGAVSKVFDPVIKIVSLGDYESEKGDVVMMGVGFQDNTGRTEIYPAQSITLQVGDLGNTA